MVKVKIPVGHHIQFQVNIWWYFYFQYVAFFGKDNFRAKPMFVHLPHNVLTSSVGFGNPLVIKLPKWYLILQILTWSTFFSSNVMYLEGTVLLSLV